MSKDKKDYFDVPVTVTLSKEQNIKLEKLSKKFDGNKSRVVRDFLNKAK